MDRFSEIKRRLIECAQKDNDIRAIIAIGSSTRDVARADEYSDLDLFIVTESVDEWYSGEYPRRLGEVSITFIEPTLGGGRERRCIYDEDKDVDMIVMTPNRFEEALKAGVCSWVMNRGYSILYDVNSYEDEIKKYVNSDISHPEMPEEEFDNIVNDFYFHTIWASKKLKRGELWSAKMCVDAYLKNYLLKMIETYCYEIEGKDVWHDGRFLDKWAGKSITEELPGCFAHYNAEDIKAALFATCGLFERITREIANKKRYMYPEKAAACARRYMPERWDAYDKSFNKIENMILERGQKLPKGVYHLVGEIIVKHTDGTFLLMQRASCKPMGGMWELTAGGSALCGETASGCAARELQEETGIQTTQLTELDRIVHEEHQSLHVEYVHVTDCDKDAITLQKDETVAYKWACEEEIMSMQEEIVSSGALKLLAERKF